MPSLSTKVSNLQTLARAVKNYDAIKDEAGQTVNQRKKAQTIVKLYKERKITNYVTAENALLRLATLSQLKTGGADKYYQNVVGKYANAESQTGSLTRQMDKKRNNVYSLEIILFRKADDWDISPEEPTAKNKRDPTVNIKTRSAKEKQEKVSLAKVRRYRDLKQYYIGSFNVNIDSFEMRLIEKHKLQLLRRDGDRESKKGFAEMVKFLDAKNMVFKDLMKSDVAEYLTALYITNATKVDKVNMNFEPKRAKNKDTTKVGAYYLYSCTPMDLTKNTFKEAIQNMSYAPDECFINTLYDFYRDNILSTDKSRNVVSRADILETIGRTEANVKEGISIEDIVPFFVKHRLQLRVFDQFYHEVFKYEPPNRNHHNKAMYCMMSNGHIYTLNHNIKRLEQKQDSECDDVKPLKATSDYTVREDSKVVEARMIDTIDDIVRIARTIEPDTEFKLVSLIHRQDNLTMLLHNLLEAGYNPGINFEAGRLTALKLSLNGIFFMIQTQQLIKSAIDGVIVVDDEATYNAMNRAMTSFNHKIFLNSHKSYYTSFDLEIIDSYRTKPIAGGLRRVTQPSDMIEIDVSKAYTSSLASIREIPIFNEFDTFVPYDGTPIQPLSLYVVKGASHSLSIQDRSLVYGKYLKANSEILAYKTPSFIKPVDYTTAIRELYDTKISPDAKEDVQIKKLIANVNIGLLEKCFNRKSRGYLFQDLAECQYYQTKMGGDIHALHALEDIEELMDLGLDDGLDEDSQPLTSYKVSKAKKTLFVLVLKAESQLKNGFRYIKELLLQGHNHKLSQALDKLSAENIPVFSVKTDCFTIMATDLQRAQQVLSFDSGIGSWRVSKKGEDIIYPADDLQVKKLKDFDFVKPVSERLKVKNEFDTEELCDIFEAKKRVMIRADYAGCGKSFACKALERRGHKVLFVCPTNKLAQNNLGNGVTLHSFFGIGLNAEQQISKFDASAYDVVVFDEIYFANIRMMARIKKYSDANPDKIILATGDTDQLECIDLISNNINYDEYMNHCIDIIFPYTIRLQTNKRLKTDEDRQTLKMFKDDCFNPNLSIQQIVNKYFKQVKEITTTNNIAYTNDTCDTVARVVRRNSGVSGDYEVGEKLVCRKFVKEGSYKFRVNFEFTIEAIGKDSLTLKDESTNEISHIKKATAQKYFIYSYCRTCHSFQGSSIDDRVTIFDWSFKFVTRKWLYTAVTRATELKNVYFYTGKCYSYDEDALNRYLELKVLHYQRQDRDAKRKINYRNFVTPQWLSGQFGKCCPGCGDCFTFEIKRGKVESNLTADRFDNDLDHNLDNITPLCCTCNQRKGKW